MPAGENQMSLSGVLICDPHGMMEGLNNGVLATKTGKNNFFFPFCPLNTSFHHSTILIVRQARQVLRPLVWQFMLYLSSVEYREYALDK